MTDASGPGLPAGSIDAPRAGSDVHRRPTLAGGWALSPDGPIERGLLVVDGGDAVAARVGLSRPDVGERYPGIAGADRAGWEAEFDPRGVPGPTATLTLLGSSGGSDWVELARTEVRVEPFGVVTAGRRAAFTIVRNEARYLPIWLDYYGRHFDPGDIYVLDHDTTDGSTAAIRDSCTVVPVHRDRIWDHVWLTGVVEDFQAFLLRTYETVLFTDVDEFIVPDPARHDGIAAYMESTEGRAACCTGYNVVHYPDEEPALDFSRRPLLEQRRYWRPSPQYSKRLIGRVPLRWGVGFHREFNVPEAEPDPDLYLVHLHRVDYEDCLERHREAAGGRWSEEDLKFNLSWHRRVVEPGDFEDWFFEGEDLEGQGRELIPEAVRRVL
jgi:hypothetical protein